MTGGAVGTARTTGRSRHAGVAVPPPAERTFDGGIAHPDLLLWDAWTVERAGALDLFTLAVARRDVDGGLITAANRDDYPFHVRRFASKDRGARWRDHGAYLRPELHVFAAAGHNVWSGSALAAGGRVLFAFTGVRAPTPACPYLQSLCLLEAAPDEAAPGIERASVLSDPERDHAAILRAGYYLGDRGELGGFGEADGPILAWRDPFLMAEPDGGIRVFWSAKVAPRRPAIGHARLVRGPNGYALGGLLPPILLPDADAFTQAEVPKVYPVPGERGFLLLVSTCDRVSEAQPTSEVSKVLRLYRSPSPHGPWTPYALGGSVLEGTDGLFGGCLVGVTASRATLIAPYSEMAEPDLRFTLAPPREVTFA